MADHNEYFIAVIPPEPVKQQLTDLKVEFSHEYRTKASLNSPPHITLHMPFRWPAKREEELIHKLERFVQALELTSFEIQVDGFGAFSPRVIFLNVVSSPGLTQLQAALRGFCKESLNLLNANFQDRPFHPHITMVFRDLRKQEFIRAWESCQQRTYRASFLVRGFTLLRHTGKRWEEFRDFLLDSGPTPSEEN